MSESNCDLFKNPEYLEYLEDILKIFTVLPYVPIETILSGLIALPKENRVITYLKKYLSENEVNNESRNSLKFEIKTLEELLPDYPKDTIIMDLMKVQNRQYRVQHVLKKYFNEKNNKRPFEDSDDVNTTTDKKIKITDLSEDKTYIIDLDDDTQESVKTEEKLFDNSVSNVQTVIQVLKELFPDALHDDLVAICREYGYNLEDVLSHDELSMFINQVIFHRSNDCSQSCTEPQPSTSSYGLEQVVTKEKLQDQNNSSTEEYEWDLDAQGENFFVFQ